MANEPIEMVRVKPLQWKQTSPDRWEADTSIGPYHVTKMPDGTYEVCDPIRCRILDCDEAAALVWCQADYEIRIITALTADKLEQSGDAWIDWEGGECPVPKGTAGYVRVEDGEAVYSDDIAGFNWRRDHRGPVPGRQIVAYQPTRRHIRRGIPTSPASHLSPDAYAENVRRQREIIRKIKGE